jgi:hypothetical protein
MTMLKHPFLLVGLSALLAVANAATISCETTLDNKIYGSTFVIQTRNQINLATGSGFPMEEARNTKEYRQAAFDFFAARYNFIFDPDVEGTQFVLGADGATPVAAIAPSSAGTVQAIAMDVQSIPTLQGRFPLTSVKVVDDGYFLTVFAADVTVSGGTIGDLVIPANSIMSYGEYRFFDSDSNDELILTIGVQTDVPATVSPAVGSQKFRFIIEQTLSSPELGAGTGYAHGTFTPIDLEGNALLDTRYVQFFDAIPNEEGVCATATVVEDPVAPTSSPTSSGVVWKATVLPIFSFVLLLVALI